MKCDILFDSPYALGWIDWTEFNNSKWEKNLGFLKKIFYYNIPLNSFFTIDYLGKIYKVNAKITYKIQ